MEIKDIFAELLQHQIKGLMTHQQLFVYYKFLGLDGYSKCHKYHYLCENRTMLKLNSYFLCHYNMLIPELTVENPNIIPENWYKYSREDVDASTKKSAVKDGLQKWLDWEKGTKKLYERMYKELINIDEVLAACFVKDMIKEVSDELEKVERYWLNKKAVNYDINYIISEQKDKKEKYKHKIKEL